MKPTEEKMRSIAKMFKKEYGTPSSEETSPALLAALSDKRVWCSDDHYANYRIPVYTNGKELIITGQPEEDDENHNCDEMGCGWLHVLYRFPLANAELSNPDRKE